MRVIQSNQVQSYLNSRLTQGMMRSTVNNPTKKKPALDRLLAGNKALYHSSLMLEMISTILTHKPIAQGRTTLMTPRHNIS